MRPNAFKGLLRGLVVCSSCYNKKWLDYTAQVWGNFLQGLRSKNLLTHGNVAELKISSCISLLRFVFLVGIPVLNPFCWQWFVNGINQISNTTFGGRQVSENTQVVWKVDTIPLSPLSENLFL